MSTPAWFDATVYFQNKLAQCQAADPAAGWTETTLAAAFAGLGIDAASADALYAHFTAYGNTAAENISPTPYFDTDFYLSAKAAAAGSTVEAVKQAFADAGLSAWDHYTLFGMREGLSPSASFDAEAYMQGKLAQVRADGAADYGMDALYAAFETAGLNPVTHYLLYGKDEQPDFVPDAGQNEALPDTDQDEDMPDAGEGAVIAVEPGEDGFGPDNDLIVLGSGSTANDTIVFGAHLAGSCTIVNFMLAGDGADRLDLSALLDGKNADAVVVADATAPFDALAGGADTTRHVVFLENDAPGGTEYIASASDLRTVLADAASKPGNSVNLFLVGDPTGDAQALDVYRVVVDGAGTVTVDNSSLHLKLAGTLVENSDTTSPVTGMEELWAQLKSMEQGGFLEDLINPSADAHGGSTIMPTDATLVVGVIGSADAPAGPPADAIRGEAPPLCQGVG